MQEQSTNPLIIQQLEMQRREIIDRVEYAFKNKKTLSSSNVVFQPDGSTAPKIDFDKATALSDAVRQDILNKVDPKDIRIIAKSTYYNNKIEVTDSHLYPELLQLVFEKAIRETKARVTSEWVKEKIQRILKHEYLHAVPVLASEGVSITYGVSVFKDDIRGGITLEPYIGVNGILSLLMFTDLISNPDNSTYSPGDSALLGWQDT